MHDVMTVIIATDNKEYGTVLFNALNAKENISVLSVVNDGKELVEQSVKLCPDIVLSELLLAHKDGISAYREILKAGLSNVPALFLMIPYSSDSLTAEAAEVGAARVIMKPCDVDVIADKIINYKNSLLIKGNECSKDLSIEIQVTNILHRIGVPAHIKGYGYLRYAIVLSVGDMSYVNAITKMLYPEVAKEFKTTTSRVERAMRHAIEVAWDRGDVDVLSSYFGYTISNMKGKPTNSEFVSMIADHIRLDRKFG